MPEISRFYGIVIKMYYNDHPPPHLHAEYGDYELVVALRPVSIVAGDAPARVRSMVLEWIAVHEDELTQNWDRCRAGEVPVAVEPLE